MPLFGRRRNHNTTSSGIGHSHHNHQRGGLFHRKDRDRVAGGFSKCPFSPFHDVKYSSHPLVGAALANPNTTHEGRNHAKHELHAMVSTHDSYNFPEKGQSSPGSLSPRSSHDENKAYTWNSFHSPTAHKPNRLLVVAIAL
jgi:hypothetical protein